VSCDCFFRNNGQGYSLVGDNAPACNVNACDAKDTGSGNNRNFSITFDSCSESF
jgi:hypothetical protein